jgi:hypothetical protein
MAVVPVVAVERTATAVPVLAAVKAAVQMELAEPKVSIVAVQLLWE